MAQSDNRKHEPAQGPGQSGPHLAGLSLLLFLVNVYVCRELFRTEYLNQMGSIEGVFIALARYIQGNWSDLTWFPLWYGGVPYQNTYSPLLPLLTAGVSKLSGMTPALAYHATVAFLYCMGPVLLFWMCLRFSRSVAFSFAAGVFHSVVAPSAFLIADIHRDLGGLLRPRLLQTLVQYGEGAHVTGLVLLPLALLLLDTAVRRRGPHWIVLAATACAGAALSNFLAAAALAIGVVSWLLACDEPGIRRRLAVTGGVALLAVALAACWMPPSTLRTVQFNSLTIEGDYRGYTRLLPPRLLALTIALAALKWGFTRLRAAQALQWGGYFTLITGTIAIGWEYWRIVIVPQPHRYASEMELGVAVLIPFALKPLIERVPRLPRAVIAGALIVAAVPFAKEHRRYARYIIQPVDITHTIEHKSARWLESNLPGSRVLLPGSVSFWLSAFGDVPQLGGAFDQGVVNHAVRIAQYVIFTSDATGERDAEISLTWLNALGIDAIGVGGPKTAEVYKVYRNPGKFDGVLEELWRDGDDVIYAVPHRRASLAHAMTRDAIPVRAPANGIDIDPLKPYVAALSDQSLPAAAMRWTSRHSAGIEATLKPEHVISVQVTGHPGWRATANGHEIPVRTDALGQVVIEPGCDGPCDIRLEYDGGLEMRIARGITWTAAAGSLVWVLAGFVRRRYWPLATSH